MIQNGFHDTNVLFQQMSATKTAINQKAVMMKQHRRKQNMIKKKLRIPLVTYPISIGMFDTTFVQSSQIYLL